MFENVSGEEKLFINDHQFKAYLEDSDISYEMKDQQLPFTPTSFNNDSMMLRVMQKAKFTFNVFSENRQECKRNYAMLEALLDEIRPSYSYEKDQLSPNFSNITGYVTLKFRGMPQRDEIRLHLTNFTYSINKDLGFISISKNEFADPAEKSFNNNDSKLIPIAYKISLEGKVLLDFKDTVKLSNEKTESSGKIDIQALLGSAGASASYQQELVTMVRLITDRPVESFRDPAAAIDIAKKLKDNFLAKPDGKFNDSDLSSTDAPQMVKDAGVDTRRGVYQRLVDTLKSLSQTGN